MIKTDKKTLISLFIIALIPSIPIAFSGIHYGHDLYFHLLRIEAIYTDLKTHTFPIYIPKLWADGYGYPSSIYYGDILLYLPAILRFFGFNLTGAYKAYILFSNFLFTFVSFISFKHILKEDRYAILSTAVYALCSYRFLDIYVRAAQGEYTAMIFLPLIMWGIYDLYINEYASKNEQNKSTWMLAIGMAGVLTCHILSLFMTVIMLFIVFILCIKRTLKKDVIKNLFIAAGKTLLLSAFFWIPFMDYMINTKTMISLTARKEMALEGAYIGDFFSFFRNSYLRDATDFNKTPGPALLLVFIIAVSIIIVCKVDNKFKFVTFISALTLFFASKFFPWNALAARISGFSIFTAIQFPWRWMEFSCLFLSLLASFVVIYMPIAKRSEYLYIILLVLSVTVNLYFSYDYERHSNREVFVDALVMDTRYVGAGEYLLEGTNDYFSLNFSPTWENMASANKLEEGALCRTYYVNAAKEGAYLEVPIFAYKGYIAKDENGRRLDVLGGFNNRLRICVPDGYTGEIRVKFKPPIYYILGIIVSLSTVIYLARKGYLYEKNRRTA